MDSITVASETKHGMFTYKPVCKIAKILAGVVDRSNLSQRMIGVLIRNGVKIIDISKK